MQALRSALFGAVLAVLWGAPTAALANAVIVEISRVGTRLDRGAFVELDVTVTCRTGRIVLEAFVYIVQSGSQSQFAPIPVTCRSYPRTYIVKVPAGETPLTRGAANASAYVLLERPAAEDTETGDDSRPLLIR
jgi:hypothetical protein